MARCNLVLANRSLEMGSVRLNPGEYLGTVELGDGVTPEYVTRALDQRMCLIVVVKESHHQEEKHKSKKNKTQVTNGRNSQ